MREREQIIHESLLTTQHAVTFHFSDKTPQKNQCHIFTLYIFTLTEQPTSKSHHRIQTTSTTIYFTQVKSLHWCWNSGSK